jgi:nuclear pore complex protein Nup98-Nup96
VFELAPEAVIRNDLELVKVLFERFVGHTVDEWHVRGKVR